MASTVTYQSTRLPPDVEAKLRDIGGNPSEGVRRLLQSPPSISKPEKTVKRVNLYLSPQDVEKLTKLAEEAGVSINEAVILMARASRGEVYQR